MRISPVNKTTFKVSQKGWETIIGDDKKPVFMPQAKVMRWGNEINFSERLVIPGYTSSVDDIDTTSGLTLRTGSIEPSFTHIDGENGGLEQSTKVLSKPIRPEINSTLSVKNVRILRQPPLTEEPLNNLHPNTDIVTETHTFNSEGTILNYRPESIVGSYAVYHGTQRWNKQGGKVMHIYRPKITDSLGNWEWCTLDINTTSRKQTISWSTTFNDSATFPCVVK